MVKTFWISSSPYFHLCTVREFPFLNTTTFDFEVLRRISIVCNIHKAYRFHLATPFDYQQTQHRQHITTVTNENDQLWYRHSGKISIPRDHLNTLKTKKWGQTFSLAHPKVTKIRIRNYTIGKHLSFDSTVHRTYYIEYLSVDTTW